MEIMTRESFHDVRNITADGEVRWHSPPKASQRRPSGCTEGGGDVEATEAEVARQQAA